MIIGVDPGSTDQRSGGTGIAWLAPDEEGSFTLRRAPHEGLASFLCRLRDEIQGLLGPDATGSMVVVERPFSSPKFPASGLALARVVGVVIEVAHRYGATVVEVAAGNDLRHGAGVTITAKGKAGKDEMINAMKSRGHSPATEHEADAWACVEYALRHTIAA